MSDLTAPALGFADFFTKEERSTLASAAAIEARENGEELTDERIMQIVTAVLEWAVVARFHVHVIDQVLATGRGIVVFDGNQVGIRPWLLQQVLVEGAVRRSAEQARGMRSLGEL